MLLTCRYVWVWQGWVLPAFAGVEMGDRLGLSIADVRLTAVLGRHQQDKYQSPVLGDQSGTVVTVKVDVTAITGLNVPMLIYKATCHCRGFTCTSLMLAVDQAN